MFPPLFFEEVKQCLGKLDLQDAIHLIRETIKQHKKIILIGNGGSASIAEHFATDFTHSLSYNVRVLSLVGNSSLITAIANDGGFGNIFVYQMGELIEDGDLLIAFSCSGTSTNIIHAILYAEQWNMNTLFFTGKGGYSIFVDERVTVDSDNPFIIETVFSAICHSIINCIGDDYESI